jgi:LPXTG-site transpeptidase (sortase) family protein
LLGAETAYAEVTSATPVVTTQSKPATAVTKKAVTQTKKANTVTTNQPLFNILNIPVGENVQNINTGTPGTLNVPALGINAPINWTQDLSTIDADLDKGVVHMPGTPMPGDVGTTYISGHSSGYAWDNSPYKNVFTQLSKLGSGDKIYVTFTNTSGKTVKLTYTFDRQGEFKPGDQNQFINTADPEIALSTCWPIGGTAKRLVVYAKLTKIE